ncbi:MAG TPA: hypothetical protein VH914_19220 [Acidimicrobiia bacterium]|nr:hypothetical protein [Acidimicrobiia bacterium]
MPKRVRKKPTRDQRGHSAWERALGLAPGESASESFVAYYEDEEIEGELARAFGVRERGALVNAVFTDRGRLVLREPDSPAEPIAFDAKLPARVAVLGPNNRRLTGLLGGAERTHLVELSSHGIDPVRIIVPESGVAVLLRWGDERPGHDERERVSA